MTTVIRTRSRATLKRGTNANSSSKTELATTKSISNLDVKDDNLINNDDNTDKSPPLASNDPVQRESPSKLSDQIKFTTIRRRGDYASKDSKKESASESASETNSNTYDSEEDSYDEKKKSAKEKSKKHKKHHGAAGEMAMGGLGVGVLYSAEIANQGQQLIRNVDNIAKNVKRIPGSNLLNPNKLGNMVGKDGLIVAGVAGAAVLGGMAIKRYKDKKKGKIDELEREREEEITSEQLQQQIDNKIKSQRNLLVAQIKAAGLKEDIPQPFTTIKTDPETGILYDPISKSIYNAEEDVFMDCETGLVWDLNCDPPTLFDWASGMTIKDFADRRLPLPKQNEEDKWEPPPYLPLLDMTVKNKKANEEVIPLTLAKNEMSKLNQEIEQQIKKAKKWAEIDKYINYVFILAIVVCGIAVGIIETLHGYHNKAIIFLSFGSAAFKLMQEAFSISQRSVRQKSVETLLSKTRDEIIEAALYLTTAKEIMSYIKCVRAQILELHNRVFNTNQGQNISNVVDMRYQNTMENTVKPAVQTNE